MGDCENKENKSCEQKQCGRNSGKHCWLKYAGIICATLLGSFLAFFVVADCALNYILSPAYACDEFDTIDSMNRKLFQDFDKINKDFEKMESQEFSYNHKSAIEFIKTKDEYKFIVDLSQFDGNENYIKVNLAGKKITISGEANYNKNNVESYTKIRQTYTLSDKAKVDKMTKNKVNDKYIITIPIEE